MKHNSKGRKAIQNERGERTSTRQPRPQERRTGTRKGVLIAAARQGW